MGQLRLAWLEWHHSHCRATNGTVNAHYFFLDESGNFDFSRGGSPYFVLGCVIMKRPFEAYHELIHLRYDLIEEGFGLEEFHAAEDRQAVRNRVFQIIENHLDSLSIHALIIEKAKTAPALHDAKRFYPEMLGSLLQSVVESTPNVDEIIVITDRVPVAKKRGAVEKAVKQTLSRMPPDDTSYRMFHHDSKSNVGIQVADYCTWAIARKWKSGDERSYNVIKQAIRTEFDIFRNDTKRYY